MLARAESSRSDSGPLKSMPKRGVGDEPNEPPPSESVSLSQTLSDRSGQKLDEVSLKGAAAPPSRPSFNFDDKDSSDSSIHPERREHDAKFDEEINVENMIDGEMAAALQGSRLPINVGLVEELEFVFIKLQEEAHERFALRMAGLGNKIDESESYVSENKSESSIAITHSDPIEQVKSVYREHIKDMVTLVIGNNAAGITPKHLALPRVCKQVFDLSNEEETTVKVQPVKKATGTRKTVMDKAIQSLSCEERTKRIRVKVHQITESTAFSLFFFVLTIYALFVPDLTDAFGSKDIDAPISILNAVVWVCFVVELLFFVVGVTGYLCTMAALLDLVALLSFLSDTWFVQGDLLGGSEGTRVTRYARSARIARLVRLVRVARVTRILPQVIILLGLNKNQIRLGQSLLTRRIRRIFRYLDHDADGYVSTFDFKALYASLLVQAFHPNDKISLKKSFKSRAHMFKLDKNEHSHTDVFSAKPPVDGKRHNHFGESDFCQTFVGTHLGKLLVNNHFVEARAGEDSGWVLTQRFSDAISLKVCVALLLIVFVMEILDSDNVDQSAEITLGQLVVLAEQSTDELSFLCGHVANYAQQYSALFVFLWNRTYFDPDAGVDCNNGGVSMDVSHPLGRIEEIINLRDVRSEYLSQACSPNDGYDNVDDCMDAATGMALLDFEDDLRDASVTDMVLTLVVIGCLCMWLLLFNRTVTGFSGRLLKPLHSLVDDMKAMTSLELVYIDAEPSASDPGAPSEVEPSKAASEVLHLEQSFKKLRKSIRSWTKYVPPALVQSLFTAGMEATLGVSRSECSILFCDIDGFEQACKGFSPSDVLNLLRGVFSKIGEVIQNEGGTLLEFIGDEILAVYNAPGSLRNHTLHAARSAVEIHKVIKDLGVVAGGRVVTCRCGVHVAKILAGNVGSHRRMKYGLLGDGVNLTARMKGLNSRYNTHTLASTEVVEDLVVAEQLLFRPIDKVAVKGRAGSTTVFELVTSSRSAHASTCIFRDATKKHTEAFQLYHRRKFVEAREKFGEAKSLMLAAGKESDEPSRQMMARCTAYIRDPPDETWDGVERLVAKTFVVPEDEALEPPTVEGEPHQAKYVCASA